MEIPFVISFELPVLKLMSRFMGSCFSPHGHTPLPKLKCVSLELATWMCQFDTFNFWINLDPQISRSGSSYGSSKR